MGSGRPSLERAQLRAPTALRRRAIRPTAIFFGALLKEEAQVLRQARSLLRAGNTTSAFAVLESSQRRIRAPELYQERESLMIELLFRSGQTASAAQRAKQFLATFPDSPHAARLRELGLP